MYEAALEIWQPHHKKLPIAMTFPNKTVSCLTKWGKIYLQNGTTLSNKDALLDKAVPLYEAILLNA